MKYFVKEYRLKNNLTIVQLSKLSGVSKSTISNIENDIKHPTFPTLCNIAKALKVDVNELFLCDKKSKEEKNK